MVMMRMMSNDGDDEGCSSNDDNDIGDASGGVASIIVRGR